MWNSKKSVILSIVLTWMCAAMLLALMFALPSYLDYRFSDYETLSQTIMVAFYCSCPLAYAALFCLVRLLTNIKNGKVFVSANILFLRLLSWCCFGVTAVTLVEGFFYLPFFLVGGAAAFLGLILRIVKNVMAAAIELREENELTV